VQPIPTTADVGFPQARQVGHRSIGEPQWTVLKAEAASGSLLLRNGEY